MNFILKQFYSNICCNVISFHSNNSFVKHLHCLNLTLSSCFAYKIGLNEFNLSDVTKILITQKNLWKIMAPKTTVS